MLATVCALVPALLLGIVPASTASADPSAGVPTDSQISATEAQVASIEQQIAQQGQKLNDLDNQYNNAVVAVNQDQAALAVADASLAKARAVEQERKRQLTADAVHAYVFGVPTQNLMDLFASPAISSTTAARAVYQTSIVGNVTEAVTQLHRSEAVLATTQAAMEAQHHKAVLAADTVEQAAQAAQAAQDAAQQTLSRVKNTLAAQVAAQAVYEAQQAAAAAAAAQAAQNQQAAQAAAAQAASAASVATSVGGTGAASAATAAANQAAAAAGSGNAALVAANGDPATSLGLAAVAAAERSLGTPYVWGGTTPGVGLDCSGLTQSSWAAAGVAIPRTSQEQYADLPHVALADVEPGDLLFFYNLDGDDSVDHVVMYVGSGPYGTATIIQAPYTGAVVSYAPVWSTGLMPYAGRP